ncbi:hypothetical protein [Bdellovibrio sp. GT3]|uniref:hypothetical protein n=1 Tax=Bdellovibrio sp. GT3 TaxID=3136282 RepID=UPI0030F03D2B
MKYKIIIPILLFSIPWVFNAATVADVIVPAKAITGGFRVDFTDPALWQNYVRSPNPNLANLINANFGVSTLHGLGTLIECMPRTIREGKVNPFKSCAGIGGQKGARSLTISGKNSNIYGISVTLASPAANNPHFTAPYSTGFGFKVFYDYQTETNINQRPKCVTKGGFLSMLDDTVGSVEATPAAKQVITLQCTHPIIVFTFKEEGYYFHELSHPQFNGYYETENVGPLIQSIDFATKNPYSVSLKLNTLSRDSKSIKATNILANPDGYTVKVPLGSYSSFALVDSATGSSLSAKYSYSTGAVLSPSISAADRMSTMFADRVAFLFGSSTTAAQTLIAVHMGQQKLLITPDDSRFSPVTVVLSVVKPVIAADEVDPNCTYVYNKICL